MVRVTLRDNFPKLDNQRGFLTPHPVRLNVRGRLGEGWMEIGGMYVIFSEKYDLAAVLPPKR